MKRWKLRKVLTSLTCIMLSVSMCLGTGISALATEDETEVEESTEEDGSSDRGVTSGVSDTDISSDYDSSMGLTNVFIRMAAGKNVVSDTEEVGSLSADELRFLGVYLSNYFVPFGTELGISAGESAEENKEQMISALQTDLNFSDSLAESLVDEVLGLIRSNNKELVICVSEEYQKGLVEVEGIPLSYYAGLAAMSGRFCDLVNTFDNNLFEYEGTRHNDTDETETDADGQIVETVAGNVNAEVLRDIRRGSLDYPEYLINIDPELEDGTPLDEVDTSYKYIYFAYEDGDGTYVPVFDAYLKGDNMTPSALAFMKCLEYVGFESGYGTNLLDFSYDEFDASDDTSDTLSSLVATDSDMYKMSIYGSRLRVDCFGDILIMGANHQFVAVPGCMNPYMWQEVDSDGSDTDNPAGSFYNMINIPSMALQDDGRLFNVSSVKELSTVGDSDGEDADSETSGGSREARVNTVALASRLYNSYWGDKNEKLGNAKMMLRVVRGSSGTNVSTTLWNKIKGVFNKDIQTGGIHELVGRIHNGAADSNDPSTYPFSVNTATVDAFGPKVTAEDGVLVMAEKKRVKLFDTMMFIDDLGAFQFDDSSSDIDWDVMNPAHYIANDDSDFTSTMNKAFSEDSNGFGSLFSDIQDGAMRVTAATNPSATVSIYSTYVTAGLYNSDSKADTIGKIGYRMNFDIFTDITESPLNLNSSAYDDVMSTSIKQWLYYLLHPTDGKNYTRILFTNIINSILLGWHNDMLGTEGVGAITGTTKYRSTVGYVTTPDLSEIEWTADLMDLFMKAIPYLAIAMLVIFVIIFVLGILPLGKCIIGLLVFCFCLLIPVPFINGVVGSSNRLLSNLYGEKFTYWALVQHESYSDAIEEASSGESYENYLRTLYQTNSKLNPNMGGDSVTLKWQAPKKMSSLMFSEDETSDNMFISSLLTGAIENNYSHEAYVDDDDAVYLYRSYIDIANFSRYIYRGIKNGTVKSKLNFTNARTDGFFDNDLRNSLLTTYAGEYAEYRSNGYTNKDKSGSSSDSTGALHVTAPMSSLILNDTFKQRGHLDELTLDDYVGINQDYFNFSIPMFNQDSINAVDTLKSQAKSETFEDEIDQYKKAEQELTGLAAYGLYSENVFYYFSWVLYDTGLEPEASVTSGYKNLLLGEDNAGYFYNTKGNGELKDFMDMKSLFTYIIPYLKQGNDIVHEWDDIYGTRVYAGVTTNEGAQDTYRGDDELEQKYWNNLNVARLYNIWTPWVGLMYDCSYAEPETIQVMGNAYVVEDPLDPASYPENRPMIFSRSEMADYSLNESDLTKVERLILKCNDEFEEAMFELLNYHTFNDVVLNTAAAMNCAFIFNKNFSESSLFGNNIEIYPQSFELTDFSYDAFLRFILANSTGENLTNNDDFYATVIENSSLTTSLCMIILDIIAMYIVPGMKIFFLILIFIASILVILVSIFRLNENQKFVVRLFTTLVKPMVLFYLITVGMAYLISLFMGVGNNSVTGTNTGSIQMGDPSLVIILMMVINVVFVILYFLVLRDVWRSVKSMGKMVGGFGMGILAAVGGVVTGSALAGALSRGGSSGGYSAGAGTASNSGGESVRAKVRSDSAIQAVESKDDRNDQYTDDERDLRSQERRTRNIGSDELMDDYRNTSKEDFAERTADIDNTIREGNEKIKLRGRRNTEATGAAQRRADREARRESKREVNRERARIRKVYRDAYSRASKDIKKNIRKSSPAIKGYKYENVRYERDDNGRVISQTTTRSNRAPRKKKVKDK